MHKIAPFNKALLLAGILITFGSSTFNMGAAEQNSNCAKRTYRWISNGIEKMRISLKYGKSINTIDQWGHLPLVTAAQAGHIEEVQTLIAHGACANGRDQYGNTALIEATRAGHVELVQILINHQADINITTQNNLSPLIIAINADNAELVQILINHGAGINSDNRFSTTPLDAAIGESRIHIIQTLITHGANISSYNLEQIFTIMPSIALNIIQLHIDSTRKQLAERYPENWMTISDHDLEQFEQINSDIALQLLGQIFYEVGEIITRDMSNETHKNLSIGCRLFRKAAINGKNMQSRTIKTELFSEFISQMQQQLILLEQNNADNKKITETTSNVKTLLGQALQQGYNMPEGKAQNTDLEAQAGPAATDCAAAQQAAQTATEASENRAASIIAAENKEYAQSLAIDQRRVALEEQIAILTTQVHAFMTEHDIHAAPLEIRQHALTLFSDIIAARTDLVGLIQATQTFGQEIFEQAKATRIAKQTEILGHEQVQRQMIEESIEQEAHAYGPTAEEIRTAREEHFLKMFSDGGKGKKAA